MDVAYGILIPKRNRADLKLLFLLPVKFEMECRNTLFSIRL